MEDYRAKIEKLPLERLAKLADIYRDSIKKLEFHYREAVTVAMQTVAEYTKAEMDKKKAELVEIELILEQRRQAEAK